MAIFAPWSRRDTGVTAAVMELSEGLRGELPAGFEAVGEHLAAGLDASVACAVAGRDLARNGAALGEALDGLRCTFALVTGSDPDFAATEALGLAWSEATLEYLHHLSCEDPLTGLASMAHVRSRLAEVYRGAAQLGGSAATSHALVMVDLPSLSTPKDHRFTRAFRLVKLGEAVRAVFPGSETIGGLSPTRVAVLVRRGPNLGRDVANLRDYMEDLGLDDGDAKLWIEGLPPSNLAAGRLLDELART